MSAASDRIDTLIDDYLSGKQRFIDFWRAFMECWADAALSSAEEEAYSDAYDTVYMGAEGSLPPHDRGVGLLTEGEVKRRLADFRRRSMGAPPA